MGATLLFATKALSWGVSWPWILAGVEGAKWVLLPGVTDPEMEWGCTPEHNAGTKEDITQSYDHVRMKKRNHENLFTFSAKIKFIKNSCLPPPKEGTRGKASSLKLIHR